MIAFFCQGGLGNQLFQYAAARRVAQRCADELVLDRYWFDHPRADETVRPLELLKYPVKLRVASTAEERRFKLLRHRFAPYIAPLLPMHVAREQGFAYNESLEHLPANSYLFGFWQSERYFADIRRELAAELSPIAPPSAEDAALLERMKQGGAVCVHVRRGDYVTLGSAAAYHGVCSLEYYQRAIEHIATRIENPTLFIFSDDPEWTRENLRTPYNSIYVNHNAAEDAFQDLRLMNHCQHHVIANSSFSWWGAWLANHSGQIVVAPDQWFQAGRPTPDLLPTQWVRL